MWKTASKHKITCRSNLVVRYGEGRATRELDLVWWQDLYNTAMLGKCALDYMLAECNWYNF